MTDYVVCPSPVTCHRCGNEESAGCPVALIATWNDRHWYACATCVRHVEGAAA